MSRRGGPDFGRGPSSDRGWRSVRRRLGSVGVVFGVLAVVLLVSDGKWFSWPPDRAGDEASRPAEAPDPAGQAERAPEPGSAADPRGPRGPEDRPGAGASREGFGAGVEEPAGEADLSALFPAGGELREVQETLRRIAAGGPFPYRQDGTVFRNREGRLPRQPSGFYREYTVETPGEDHRGARRIVQGRGGETRYTRDHYRSFTRIDPDEVLRAP